MSDAKELGSWFGVEFDGAFVAGKAMTGRITPTKVDAEVAKLQQPHEGKPFEWTVERIEPEHSLSFRWHPFAMGALDEQASSSPCAIAPPNEAAARAAPQHRVARPGRGYPTPTIATRQYP